MKLKNLILASVAIAGVLAATSCKKDKAAEGIDKSIFNGQWMCSALLENNGPMYEYPSLLWDIDVAGNKANVFSYFFSPYSAGFDVSGDQIILKQGSSSTHYDITSYDEKHMVLTEKYNSDVYEYHFNKMNAILLGDWAITWYMGNNNNVTQYYRFKEGGAGARLTQNGEEAADFNWSIKPAENHSFKFVLSIPSLSYQNTLAILHVYSDSELSGVDDGDNSIGFNRMK